MQCRLDKTKTVDEVTNLTMADVKVKIKTLLKKRVGKEHLDLDPKKLHTAG